MWYRGIPCGCQGNGIGWTTQCWILISKFWIGCDVGASLAGARAMGLDEPRNVEFWILNFGLGYDVEASLAGAGMCMTFGHLGITTEIHQGGTEDHGGTEWEWEKRAESNWRAENRRTVPINNGNHERRDSGTRYYPARLIPPAFFSCHRYWWLWRAGLVDFCVKF